MKKFLGNVIIVISIATILWIALSWGDIIMDNDAPNPVHHKYNAFTLLTEVFPLDEEPQPAEAGCGNPLTHVDNICFGTVYAKTEYSVIFEVEDGNLYEVRVGNPLHFHENAFYCLFFEGDRITKAWVEVW